MDVRSTRLLHAVAWAMEVETVVANKDTLDQLKMEFVAGLIVPTISTINLILVGQQTSQLGTIHHPKSQHTQNPAIKRLLPAMIDRCHAPRPQMPRAL